MGRRLSVAVFVSVISLAGAMVAVAPAQAATTQTSTPSIAPVGGVDAATAATETAASATAQQFDHPVAVASETTPTTQVSALPDGTMQLVSSTSPVRVKTGSGWVPVNASLAKSADGLLAPAATDVPVEFSDGGTGPLARQETSGGKWLDIASPFGSLPTPAVAGATATYTGVLPGVNLLLTATPVGMSDVLVITSAAAAANPKLKAVEFTFSGNALSPTGDGGADAATSDGSRVHSSTPTWWDSSDGSDAAGPVGNAFADPVAQTVVGTSISLDAQAAALSRPVTYPVFVDPDTSTGLQAYTYVDAAYPGQSYWDGAYAGGQQRVGYVTAGYSSDGRTHTARSFDQFDTSPVEGAHINSAQFSTTEDWSFSCTPSDVQLWWTGSISTGTTWNSAPGWIQLMDDESFAHGHSSACPSATVALSATPAVVAAAAISAPSVTVGLRAAYENQVQSWKRFGWVAGLTIDYNSIPTVSASTIASPTRACGTSTAPAFLNSSSGVTAQATTANTDGTNVTTVFNLYNESTNALIQSSATATPPPGPQAMGVKSWTFTSPLANNGLYYWTATAASQTSTVPPVTLTSSPSAPCYFEALLSGPALPTVTGLPVAPTTTSVGAPIAVTFNSAPADHVVGFAYWWGDGQPSASGPPPPLASGYSITAASATFPTGGTAVSTPATAATPSFDGSVRYAAPIGTTGSTATLQVATIDQNSTLYVTSFDAAGNESSSAGAYSTSSYVSANPSATVDYINGHEWNLEGLLDPVATGPDGNPLPLPLPNPVVDSNTTGGTALTSSANLALGSAVTLNGVGTPTGIANTTVFSFTPVASPTAANLVATTHPAVNTLQSFTVTAFANPAAIPTSGAFMGVLISQVGSTNSGFWLGIDANGEWEFCIEPQVGPFSYDCAVSGSSAQLSNWTQVTGIWDAVNQQVRLLVGNTMVGPATAHTVPTGDVSAAGSLRVGSAQHSGTIFGQFNGQIDDPAIFPGVIDATQLGNLANFSTVN